MRYFLLFCLSALSLLASDAFITASEFEKKLGQERLIIVDVGSEKAYKEAHIPGAVNTNIGAWRQSVNKHKELRSAEEITQEMRRLGINDDSYVVLYGHNEGKDTLKSSYLAFAMASAGFENFALLDGSFNEWRDDEERTLSAGVETNPQGTFTPKPNPYVKVDLEYVRANIGKLPMLDARPTIYYYGTHLSKGVKRYGHISGGMSSLWKDKFRMDETLHDQEVLDAIYLEGHELSKGEEVILFCTGGLEASMNWYLLYKHMGFKKARLYDASMREWGNRDDTPMTRYKWEQFRR